MDNRNTTQATTSPKGVLAQTQYPQFSISDQYSIFLIHLRHGLVWKQCKKKLMQEKHCKTLTSCGWQLHPYLLGKRERFFPQRIFTASALTSFFGNAPKDDIKPDITASFLKDKLNPMQGNLAEPLLLELDPEKISGKWRINGHTSTIGWVDLYLFQDGTGFLALKTELVKANCSINDLSAFHRVLRDVHDTLPYTQANQDVQKHGEDFWQEVVYDNWLQNGRALYPTDPLCRDTLPAKSVIFSPGNNYAKLLTFTQVDLDEKDSHLWDRPMTEPDLFYGEDFLSNQQYKNWDMTTLGHQQAAIANYPTVRDLLLFEIATLSDKGASVGWYDTGYSWQYNIDYIRRMVDQNSMKIWEYWSGMALQDTCTFVSFDKSMPIGWQSASWYYPLYLATWYMRLRLEQLRCDIIEYDMADTFKGREIKHQLAAFRNHFWFNEMTTFFVSREVFAGMKNGLAIDKLFEQVSTEITEISEHLKQRWERVSRVWLACLIFSLPLLKSFWEDCIYSLVNQHWLITLVGVLIALICGWFVWKVAGQKIHSGWHWCRRRFLVVSNWFVNKFDVS